MSRDVVWLETFERDMREIHWYDAQTVARAVLAFAGRRSRASGLHGATVTGPLELTGRQRATVSGPMELGPGPWN